MVGRSVSCSSSCAGLSSSCSDVFCFDVESSSSCSVDNPLSCDGCSSTVSDSVTVTSGSDALGLASDVSSVELPHPVIASPAANTNAAKGFVGVLVDIAASPRRCYQCY